jgi:hypothetical protein
MRAVLLAACAYAALAVWLSWPLARTLGTGVVDPVALGGGPWARADLDLVVWILAWDAHALVTRPLHVFDANIFHPARNALASSEHLLGLAPVAAPMFLASGNPVLAYNVTVLVTVVVAALAAFAAVRAWTRDPWAALFAGAVFGFAPMVVVEWTRLHNTAVHLFPLVLLFAWRAAGDPRPRVVGALVVVTALQLLAGVYVAFELLAALVAIAPFVWWEARRHGRSGLAPAAGIAAAMVPLAAVAVPYARALRAGVVPDAGAVAVFSRPDLIPGLLLRSVPWPVAGLAVLGVATLRVPARLRLGLVAVAVLGGLVAVGPALPGFYALAARWLPGFAAVRAPLRFLVVPLCALALLAGFGAAAAAAALRPRLGTATVAGALVAAAVAVAAARGPRVPLPIAPVTLDGGERWLAAHADGGAVLQLPAVGSAMDAGALLATTHAMVASTRHWLPLVNGYSGHAPASDRLLMTLAQRLPDEAALRTLCALTGLRWIVLRADLEPALLAGWGSAPVARVGNDAIYRVERPCGESVEWLRAQLAGRDDGRTLGGVPRAPLPPRGERGRVRGTLPRLVISGFHGWFWVDVQNRSRLTWPGVSALPAGTIALQARWRDARTGAVVLQGERVPLAADMAPGAVLHAQVETMMPPPGRYLLEVGLVQEGRAWFADRPGGSGLLRRRVHARLLAG